MIRKNFLSDAASAKKYVDGVMLLKDPKTNPWPGQNGLSIYDALVFWHHQSMMMPTPPSQTDRNAAHSGPAFLPWHRYFLLRLETLLQKALKDDAFRIPYWDWTVDAALPDPKKSRVWSADMLGGLEGPNWTVRLAFDPRTGRLTRADRALRRNLGGADLPFRPKLPTPADVQAVTRAQTAYDSEPYNSDSEKGLRNYLEGWTGSAGLHNMVHNWVGGALGDMALPTSPNDPAFFLHHCNVDRIWAAWQAKYKTAPYLPGQDAPDDLLFHRIDDALYSIFDEKVRIRAVLDPSARYSYDTLDGLTAAEPLVA